MDELDMDLYDPFDRFVEITFKGKKVQVPENNLLLRCFQYLDTDCITYGSFCWNNECGNCEIQYVMKEGDAPVTARSCQTKVIEGMSIIGSTRHVRLKLRG
ncbi:MAG TPA: 2Fe-2S iron-sulfur cluster-binding protein [Candidatus Xenobia bacterium]|jgi:predicted molibdopterin-dependent oxidoreductase YjgC